MTLNMHPSLAVHPGDWLKSEIVDPHEVSIIRLAIQGPDRTLCKNGDPVREGLWRKGGYTDALQTAHDLAKARAQSDEIVVDEALFAA